MISNKNLPFGDADACVLFIFDLLTDSALCAVAVPPKSDGLWLVLVFSVSRSPTLLGVRFRLVQSGSGLV